MDKVSDNLLIEPKYLEKLREIFREHFSLLSPFQVWAFGSRVNGLAHGGSDLDLVISSDKHVESAMAKESLAVP